MASAALVDFRVLIDADNDIATGCPEAGMAGVDHVLVTRVQTTDTTATVLGSYRLACTNGHFGAQLDPNTTGWPAGFKENQIWVESRMPFSAFGPGTTILPRGMRFGFEARTFVSHKIFTNANGTPILWPPVSPGKRRSADSGAGDPRTIVLDSSPKDWGAIAPAAHGGATSGNQSVRMLKVFLFGNSQDHFLYVGFDAFVSNDGPFAQDDNYSRPLGQALSVPPPGVLANDGDPDGQPLTALPVSPAQHGTIVLNPDGSFTYTPANPNNPATDQFEYKANNGSKDSNVAKVKIKVSIGNDPPVANDDAYTATEDVQLAVPAPGVLTNDTDADLDPLTAALLAAPARGVVVLNANGGFTYTPNENYFGGDSFTYTVSDGEETDTAVVTITVESANDVPVADNKSVTTNEEQAVAVTLSATDTEGEPLTFNAGTPANGVLSGTAPNLTYTPNANFFGIDTFTYTATDGTDTSDPAAVTITVNPVNDVPSFTAGPSPITRSANGGAYSAPWASAISAGPNEGSQALNFIVSNNNNALFSVQPAITPAGVLTFTPAGNALGSATVTVQLHDNGGTANGGVDTTAAINFTITITCPTITVTNPGVTTATAGTAFSQTFTQNGGIGTTNFTTSSPLPNGLALAANGTLSGTPTVTGTFNIVVTATDSQGCTGTGATYSLVVGCPAITVTNPATTTATVGTAFSRNFTQSGGVGATTFATSSPLPNGVTLASNGTLSGTPTQFGTFNIVVTATDSNGCSGTGATYSLVVSCQSITVTNPATNTGTAGTAFSQNFTQSGALGGATFSTGSPLPNGLSLASNGTLSGTPTQTGVFNIVVTVTDGNGCTGTGSTYTLTIGCQAITVTNPANANGTAGAAFSETFTQSGAIGTAVFSTNSPLPNGISLASNGVLAGTPTVTGNFNIVVTVTDQNGCTGTGATYSLNIGCQTITVTNPSNASGTANAAFSQTFTQSGAIGTPQFTTASNLPDGITLAANGLLAGTPTETGNFPIVVLVTDANGCTGTSATYNLNIACQTITVNSPANVSGTVSSFFSEQFSQSGAIGTAVFTTASALPNGITLSNTGLLSGTPTEDGLFSIIVTVTDDNLCTGNSAQYDLNIACQTITVNNPATTSSPAGTPLNIAFTQSGSIGTADFATTSTLPTGLTLNFDGTLTGTPTQGGVFSIAVTVTDDNGCTGTNPPYSLTITCPTITVTSPANNVGTSGQNFSEQFSQSGGNGTIVWSVIGTLPSGISIDSSTGILSGTTNAAGVFSIVVRATDANGCTGDSATYNLTINCQTITVSNPATNTGTVDTAFATDTFTVTGILGTVTWSVQGPTALPLGMTLNSTNGQLSGTPEEDGTFNLTIRATDTNGCFDDSAYTLTISCQLITVTAPVVNTGTVDALFSQQFSQSGAHGTHTYATSDALPDGVTLSSAGLLEGTPNEDGVFAITVTVTDQNGCQGSVAYTLTINCQAISVSNPANATGTVNVPFSEQFGQSGAHGTHTYATSDPLPSNFTLSPSGLLSGTTTQAGNFLIDVTVTDQNGCTGVNTTYNLTINCQTITVTNPAVTTGTVSSPFDQDFLVSGNLGAVTWSVQGPPALPNGLTLNPSTGKLSGTPLEDGTFNLTIRATDTNGCFDDSAYTLIIGCQTITVTNPGNNTGTAGTLFTASFGQSGAVGTAVFSTSSTLPSGINLQNDGTLTGTTNEIGTFNIIVTVTDSNGCQGTGTQYDLTIGCQTVTVSNPTSSSVQAGTSVTGNTNFKFNATGILGTATWTLESGTFPTGITLNSSTGQLEGSSSVQGTHPVTVKVTDTNTCFDVSDTYNLEITCPVITVTRNAGDPAGVINTAYAGPGFAASGGAGTYDFTVGAGFPTGLTLNLDGTITGTPTVTGTFTFTITATDDAGCIGTQGFTIDIKPKAVNDSYGVTPAGTQAVGNTQVVVGVHSDPSTPHVDFSGTIIDNDEGTGITVTAVNDLATTQGGRITIDTAGKFTYSPPAGFTGDDSYTYTITSNGITNTGVITIRLADVIWYVNKDYAGGNGASNGTSHRPYTVMNDAATAAQINQTIYVHTGTGSTAGNTQMKDGQVVHGAGRAFTLRALTIAATGNPTLSSPIALASGTTVRGVTAANGGGFSIQTIAPLGTSSIDFCTINGLGGISMTTGTTGSLNVTNTTINTSGGGNAVLVDAANSNLTIASTSSVASNGGTGVLLQNNSSGTVTFNGLVNTTGQGAGNHAVRISSNSGTFAVSFTANVILAANSGSGAAGNLRINNNTNTGGISFSGSQQAFVGGGSALGADLDTNTGVSISFTGGQMQASSQTGVAFRAVGGGTISLTGANNTASSTGGSSAVEISNTTIHATNGVTFLSVSQNGGTNGILLNSTGAGTFTVTGTATTAGSGGTLQSTAGAALSMTNTTAVSIANMTFTSVNTGIFGSGFGTLTIATNNISITSTSALNLTNGTIAGQLFSSVTSTGGTNGVHLDQVSGTWGTSGGALSGATGATFNVTGAAAAGSQITWGASISQSNGANVVTIGGGHDRVINFNGNVNATGSSTGLTISGSSGTYNFNATNQFTGAGGITIGPSQSGTVAFSANTTNTTNGSAFVVAGGTAAITYSGTINKTSAGVLISVNGLNSPGTLSMTPGTLVQNHANANGISITNSSSTNITITGASVSFGTTAPGFTASGNTGTINLNGIALTSLASGTQQGMLISGGGTINVGGTTPSINVASSNKSAIDGTTSTFTGTLNLAGVNITGSPTAGVDVISLAGGTLGGTGSTINSVANRALALSGVALANAGTMTVTTTGGVNGISLTNVTGGTYTIGGALSGATGSTFNVSGGTATVTYNGTITQATASQRAVSIVNHATGTLTFGGNVTATEGTGLLFSNADGTYNFNATNNLAGTGDEGIDILADSAGTFSFSANTTITTPSGIAFNMSASAPASMTYAGQITHNSGRAVEIDGDPAGAPTTGPCGANTFSGNITSNGASATGIRIQNCSGGTILFSANKTISTQANNAVQILTNGATVDFTGGNLDIDTTSGVGFTASGGGTVTVQGGQNTIDTLTGTALTMTTTQIGANNMTFRRIDTDGNAGAPTNAIFLSGTGSTGGLVVTGTGAAGSGGTLEDTGGDAILLSNSGKHSLTRMIIQNNGGSGIKGTTVNGLAVDNCSFISNGDDANFDESGINLIGLTGTLRGGTHPTTIANSTFNENYEFEIQVTNSSGSLPDFYLNTNTISATGADGVIGNLVNFLATGTASMTIDVDAGTFTGSAPNTATALHLDASGGTINATVDGGTYTNNNCAISTSIASGGDMIFDIDGITATGTRSHVLNTFVNANAGSGGSISGKYLNNVIGSATANSGSTNGAGIRVQNEGASPTTVRIDGNTIRNIALDEAILVNIGLSGAATAGSTTNLTITNNPISNISANRAIEVNDNQDAAFAPFPTVCVNMTGNTFSGVSGQAGNGQEVRFLKTSGTFNVTQKNDTAAVDAAELDDANGGNGVHQFADAALSGSISYNQAACPTP